VDGGYLKDRECTTNLLKALSIINESGGSGDAAVQYSVLANGTPDMESWPRCPWILPSVVGKQSGLSPTKLW
jgi:hypothetical protein